MSKTEQSRKAYNQKAADYENTADGRFTRPLKQLMFNTIPITSGQRVLDVACGTGDLIAAFAKKANIQAYGTDIAEEMIKTAQTKHKNITYSVSPAYPLPFKNSSMDVITVSAAFHHFEQPQQFANECRRVLSDSGRLYVGEFSYSPVTRVIFNALLPLLKSGDVKLYSRNELAEYFEKARFRSISVESAGRCEVFSFEKGL
jgi:ubiquinone/menaquinone biosynthesis C-methylase UbiE